MSKIVILVLVFITGVATLAGCLRPPAAPEAPKDGIDYVTQRYEVPLVRVVALARLLGVSPSKIPVPHSDNNFPFPISHFKQKFEEFQKTEDRLLLRADVDK